MTTEHDHDNLEFGQSLKNLTMATDASDFFPWAPKSDVKVYFEIIGIGKMRKIRISDF